MQHARDRTREITDRRRLLVPVDDIVQDVNRFLRGWSGYFRYGNSARQFNTINLYALNRLSRFVAKRHKRSWRYGWKAVAYHSPDRLGLINLNGTIVAPRPNPAVATGTLNADGEERRRAVCGRTACTVRCGGGRKPGQSARPCSPGASRRPYRDLAGVPALHSCSRGCPSAVGLGVAASVRQRQLDRAARPNSHYCFSRRLS